MHESIGQDRVLHGIPTTRAMMAPLAIIAR
jgi:hypothetical protein